MSGFLQWFAGLFASDDDDDMTNLERHRLQQELQKARLEAIPDVDFRQPPWLFEPLQSKSNVFIFIASQQDWDRAVGKYEQKQDWIQNGVLLLDTNIVHRYARVTYFAKSRAEEDKPVLAYQRNDLVLIYAYFYDQERDESNADNEHYLPDVRFERQKGTRLMRPFEKGRDLYAAFTVRMDARTNKLTLPSPQDVTEEFEKCAKQYVIKINKRHWRF